MYNEERKREHLKSLKEQGYSNTYIKIVEADFKKIEEYEIKFNKDVCDFTLNEIMEMYSHLNLIASSLTSLTTRLRTYSYNQNEALGDFAKVTKAIIREKFGTLEEKNTIISYADLKSMLDKLDNAVDKFFIYGLFSGIKGHSYVELSCSSMEDANVEELSFWLAGITPSGELNKHNRKFYADQELFNYALEASESNIYIQRTKEGAIRRIHLQNNGKDIYKNPVFIEKTDNLINLLTKVRNKLNSLLKVIDVKGDIKPTDLYWSGLRYNLKRIGLERGIMINDLKDIKKLESFATDIKKIEEQYQIKFMSRSFKDGLKRYL